MKENLRFSILESIDKIYMIESYQVIRDGSWSLVEYRLNLYYLPL